MVKKMRLFFPSWAGKSRWMPILCAFLLFPVAVFPQNVDFIADWHKGDVYRFNVKKTIQKDKQTVSIAYTLTMSVLDSTESGYRLRMRYDNVPFDLFGDSLENLGIDLSLVDELYDIYYTTNAAGEMQGIENADAIIATTKKLMASILEATGEDLDEGFMGILDGIYTEEYLMTNVYKEISLLHGPLGYSYPIKKPIVAKIKMENPISGGNFNAKTVTSVEEYDPETQFCRLHLQTLYDNAQLKKAVKQLFKAFKGLVGQDELKEGLKNSYMTLVQDDVFEFKAYPGIPLKVESRRGTSIKIGSDESVKHECFVIELAQ